MISITCPAGRGQTDLTRCLDMMLEHESCAHCPIPVAMVAQRERAGLSASLRRLISCPLEGYTTPTIDAVRLARMAYHHVKLPTTLHHFYLTMRSFGCPRLTPRDKRLAVQLAGGEIVTANGVERVVRERGKA